MSRAEPVTAYDWKNRPKPKKVLREIRIEEAENGGHSITHHFTSYEHDPETHVFGKEQGEEALLHIAQHANIKSPDAVVGEQAKEREERGGEEGA